MTTLKWVVYKTCLLSALVSLVQSILTINDIKGLDDSLLFRINWPGYEESLLDSPLYETLEMVTDNKEKFHCLVPRDYGAAHDDSESYTGPNAMNLLMPLFKKPVCTLRLESYWTYELCHGEHIKQFHEDRDGKKAWLLQYDLGKASLESLKTQALELDLKLQLMGNKVEVPQTTIEGASMPSFEVVYDNGTPCDLTGNARVTKVLYVCFEEGRHAVYSVKETFTCEYEIIILTSLLCVHPAYRPQEVPQTDLHCVPVEDAGKRPSNLLLYEAEGLKLRTQGAVLNGINSKGSVNLKLLEGDDVQGVQKQNAIHPNDDNDDDNEGLMDSNVAKGTKPLTPFPPQPSVSKKLMKDFLNGDYCLDGGSGWWQYEFCYGKSVHQYHRNRDGSKVDIHLGSFDKLAHVEWIAKNPHKRYRRGRQQVSHFFAEGDYCADAQRNRQVEVKLKCKEEESKSENAVSLYLLEPKTCEYVLGVETALVCELIKNANEMGLFSIDGGVEATEDANELEISDFERLLTADGDSNGWKPIVVKTAAHSHSKQHNEHATQNTPSEDIMVIEEELGNGEGSIHIDGIEYVIVKSAAVIEEIERSHASEVDLSESEGRKPSRDIGEKYVFVKSDDVGEKIEGTHTSEGHISEAETRKPSKDIEAQYVIEKSNELSKEIEERREGEDNIGVATEDKYVIVKSGEEIEVRRSNKVEEEEILVILEDEHIEDTDENR